MGEQKESLEETMTKVSGWSWWKLSYDIFWYFESNQHHSDVSYSQQWSNSTDGW